MGSPVEDFDVASLEREFTFRTVPKPHPMFPIYGGEHSVKTGICSVMAFSDEFQNDCYGYSVRGAFARVSSAISSKYGPGLVSDDLEDGSIWGEARDWVMAIHKNERTFRSVWTNVSWQDERYSQIVLTVLTQGEDSANLALEYRSAEYREFIKARDAQQDEVF